MIKIAFCDDDVSVLDELSRMLNQYCLTRGRNINSAFFRSPLDLMADLERGMRYDALFLDILMPGESGMDIAAEIRTFDQNIKIIFLSTSPEYAAQSYLLNAYFYQLKPICTDKFFRLLDSIVSENEAEQSNSLIVQCKTGLTRIRLMQLKYCEVLQHTLFFHLSNGTVLESSGSMNELAEKLASYHNFYRCHRSYIVNLEYVESVSCHHITMSGFARIPVPRGKYHEIKDAYLKYAFQSGRVIV